MEKNSKDRVTSSYSARLNWWW